MNIKMAINPQLPTIESKKQTKQTSRTEKDHRYGDHLEGYPLGGGRRRTGEKVQGLRSINGR